MPALQVAPSRLLDQLQSARAESDRLFRILTPEGLYERPIAQRHRVIFYLGHLDGFDAIQICREALGVPSKDAEFDSLFQAGIDPGTSNLPSDKPADWPGLREIQEYVQRCRARVDEHLERAPEEVVLMALEHRQMHLETLAYMFHNFDYSMKVDPVTKRAPSAPPQKNSWREIPAGDAVLGMRRGEGFGWDNEFEEHRVHAASFQIQRFKVTNGEYLEFVKAGARAPHFWRERGGEFYLRGMFEEMELPLDWPVYTTQLEAESYAAWVGKSLPSEAQFHRAAYSTPEGGTLEYPWGSAAPAKAAGNFDFRRWDPESAYAAGGESPFGVSQLVGNGWEWTRTPFAPFPGFEPYPTYPGYSANFFDGEHYVIKGGSARTAARLLRRSFRNWFRRDYPYVYASFRCVEN